MKATKYTNNKVTEELRSCVQRFKSAPEKKKVHLSKIKGRNRNIEKVCCVKTAFDMNFISFTLNQLQQRVWTGRRERRHGLRLFQIISSGG